MEARAGISGRGLPERWDLDVDIVVVGFGAAGAVAAIEATRAGSDTLVLEKMAFPGGLSAASAGGIRVTNDPEQGFLYLQATCGGRTPDDVLRVLAAGMAEVPAYIRELAQASDAEVRTTEAIGNYPLPGYGSLGYCEVRVVPAIEAEGAYCAMRPISNGTRLFKVLEDNVRIGGAQIRMQATAERLITDESGAVVGLFASIEGGRAAIRARQAVILTCGGFEADRAMQQQYFAVDELLTGSFRGNTGDGIRMAQAAGADLWHMWHHHGPYGLKHPDPDYPFALYLKAVPMWTPGRLDEISTLGVETGAGPHASARKLAPMAWIAVDRNGRRFMDEYPPYPGDAGVRPFDVYDFKTQTYARNPAFIVFDEEGRKMYPMGRSVHNDPHPRYQWSKDNLKEVENGLLKRADTLAELAAKLDLPEASLTEAIERWNVAVGSGRDDDFGRLPETMRPVSTPPYYAGRIYPILINTQGGPRHDRHQRVLDPFGEPISGLYAAGELGSVFGHVYVSGGNLAECVVGGWTAARHAVGRARSDSVGAAFSASPVYEEKAGNG